MNKRKLREKLSRLVDLTYGKLGTKRRDELEHKVAVQILTKDTPTINN
jgi:hypothetical protein